MCHSAPTPTDVIAETDSLAVTVKLTLIHVHLILASTMVQMLQLICVFELLLYELIRL